MSKEPKRNVYVGHRYVPKVMGEWDKTESYEGLSIVTNKGTSYTSKKRVPVGIDILDEEYWVVTGNYNAQIEEYRKDIREIEKEVGKKSDQSYVDNLNEKVTAQLAQSTNGYKPSWSVWEEFENREFNIMWSGAFGDGITDDTQKLQLFFDELPSHSKVIFPSDRTFIIREPIKLNKPIFISGNLGEIKIGDNSKIENNIREAIHVNSSHVTIDKLKIDCNGLNNYLNSSESDSFGNKNYKTGKLSAISIVPEGKEIENIVITNNQVRDGENLIYVRGSETLSGYTTRNVQVVGNKVEQDRGNGVLVIGGVENCKIDNNAILNGSYHSIRVYHSARDIVISNNLCYNDYNEIHIPTHTNPNRRFILRAGISVAKGSAGEQVDSMFNITVVGNTITSVNYLNVPIDTTANAGPIAGINIGLYTKDVKVKNNVINGSIDVGLRANGGVRANKLFENNLVMNTAGRGMWFTGMDTFEVLNNTLKGYDLRGKGNGGICINDTAKNGIVKGNYVRQTADSPAARKDIVNLNLNNGVFKNNDVETADGITLDLFETRLSVTKGQWSNVDFDFLEDQKIYTFIITMDNGYANPLSVSGTISTGNQSDKLGIVKHIDSTNTEISPDVKSEGKTLQVTHNALGSDDQFVRIILKKIN